MLAIKDKNHYRHKEMQGIPFTNTQDYNINQYTTKNSQTPHSPLHTTEHKRREMAAVKERTYIMVKPDGVQRGLVGEIIKRFENRGFKLVAMKFKKADEALLEKHYADLKAKSFFKGLIAYVGSGPVTCMIWEGKDAVKTGRKMLGETDPLASLPGTIRGDYCLDLGRNIIHGSDSVDSANKEIGLWFKPEEIVDWQPLDEGAVYE